MPGLDRIFDFLMSIIGVFRFWVIVREGDRTVIYRLGRVRRVLEPGLHWKWFGWDHDETTSVREDWKHLARQTMKTADQKTVNVEATFRIQVDPAKVVLFQTELGDEDTSLHSALVAAVGETLARHNAAEIWDPDELGALRGEILSRARKYLGRYGYRIHDFAWSDRFEAPTFRFITGE